jgi:tetratricopeptide (TPR) repeat protein
MQKDDQALLVFGLVLPLILALMISLSPNPWTMTAAMDNARVATDNHLPEQAAGYLRQAVQFEPWRVELWFQIAELELQGGNPANAITAFVQASRVGSLTADQRQTLGEAYVAVNDNASAIQVWQALIQSGQATSATFGLLTDLQWKSGDFSGAEQTYRAWLAAQPENAETSFRLGLLLVSDHPQEALKFFQEALSHDASLQAQVDSLRQALSLAELKDDQSYQQVLVGRSLGSLGFWDLAVRSFNDAVDLNPNYAEAWAFLGEAYQHLDKDGYPKLQKAQSLGPDSITVKALLALYWRRQGQPAKALPTLQAVAAAEPTQATWQIELGTTLADMGKVNEALPYFQQAVQLEPGSAPYWEILAQFCIANELEQRTIGLPAARQAVLLAPNDPAALDTMGLTMYSLGDMQEAERFYLRALQANPNFAFAHLHLAQVYLQTGQYQPAYQQISKALDLSKNQLEVQTMAQRLLRLYFGGG